jgi:hypothetical protein
MAALWSVGVGGNLPVDSAVFLGQSQTSRSVDQPNDCLRVRACIPSIFVNRALNLVGIRPASRLLGIGILTSHWARKLTYYADCMAAHRQLLVRSHGTNMLPV